MRKGGYFDRSEDQLATLLIGLCDTLDNEDKQFALGLERSFYSKVEEVRAARERCKIVEHDKEQPNA